MDKIKELINALASKSGGGGDSSETLEPQGVRAVALFLADGRVALWPVETPSVSGGAADSSLRDVTPSVTAYGGDSSLKEGALNGGETL